MAIYITVYCLSACLKIGPARRERLCGLGFVRLPKMLVEKGNYGNCGDCLKIAYEEYRTRTKAPPRVSTRNAEGAPSHFNLSLCSVIVKGISCILLLCRPNSKSTSNHGEWMNARLTFLWGNAGRNWSHLSSSHRQARIRLPHSVVTHY